jgi:hypothetical protein
MQLRFSQVAGTTIGGTTTLTGSYDFVSHTFQTNTGSVFKFSGTSPGEFTNGLYAEVFLWSEGGESIDLDFSNITVSVTGVSTPVSEPTTMSLVSTGLIGMVAAGLRRKKRSVERLAGSKIVLSLTALSVILSERLMRRDLWLRGANPWSP